MQSLSSGGPLLTDLFHLNATEIRDNHSSPALKGTLVRSGLDWERTANLQTSMSEREKSMSEFKNGAFPSPRPRQDANRDCT